VDNIKTWVKEDSIKVSCDECDWKHELGDNKPTDSEMLRTYATGLLAISLAGYAADLPFLFFFLFSRSCRVPTPFPSLVLAYFLL